MLIENGIDTERYARRRSVAEAKALLGLPPGRLLIGAARSMLGMIDERFQLKGGENSRILLREADTDLKAIELSESVPANSFNAWRNKWASREHALRSAEAASLFSEAVIRRQLGEH